MPNWTTNKLVITGNEQDIDSLIKQVRAPYQSPHDENPENDETIEGEFLLWNIIRPLNINAYLGKDKEEAEPMSAQDIFSESGMASLFEKFNRDVETKNDWYNWNIRNWGTKWEINDSWRNEVSATRVEYEFQTAWSPPVDALDKLAEQYPRLAFTMRYIDEGSFFCGESQWNNGERIAEIDLAINHDTMVEFWGKCYTCDVDFNGDDLDAEQMAEMGCPMGEKAE